MHISGVISSNRRNNPKQLMQARCVGPAAYCPAPNCDTVAAILPQQIQPKSPSYYYTQQRLFRAPMPNPNAAWNGPGSYSLHGTGQKSDMFRTNIQSSPSTSSPFIQQGLMTSNHGIISSVNSPGVPFLLEEEPGNEGIENLDLFDIIEESNDGNFQCSQNHGNGSLTSTDIERLDHLWKELEAPIDNDNQNPNDNQTCNESEIAQLPNNCGPPQSVYGGEYIGTMLHLREAVTSHKQRIRWTTELHDLFVDAVKILGGPENATPKKILGLMKVEGLNIYHVKSHLQKYRLHKNLPEVRPDKRTLVSLERKTSLNNNDTEVHGKSERVRVTEAWRMQMELQKLLHEQLKAQRELQVSIEQNGEFLKRLIEQQKALAKNDLPPLTGPASESNLWTQSQMVTVSPASPSRSDHIRRPHKRPREEDDPFDKDSTETLWS